MSVSDGNAGQRVGGPDLAWLRRAGMTSWLALGVIALVVVLAGAVSSISGIVIPAVIAVILGTVLEPLVSWLRRHKVSSTLATVTGLVVALLVGVGLVAVVVWGFIRQLPEITRQLLIGWESFLQWGRSLEIDSVWLDHARAAVQQYAPYLGQGVLGAVTSTFSGAVSFGVGTFFSVFILFFVLQDGHQFPGWLARVTKFDAGLVQEVDDLVKDSLQGYFRGVALTALITAPVFMIPLLVMRVPLAVPIFILYFFLSFLPYIGPWITGAFAVLIAFGSGGALAALVIAVSLLASNGTIQSAVSSWALGSALEVHPVAVLLATIVGGTAAGILGMILGPPLLAAIIRSVTAVRAHRTAATEDDGDPAANGVAAGSAATA